MLFLSSNAAAWQVNITNKCKDDVYIQVDGDHLFWKQLDCTVDVKSGATGTCKLPGAICPTNIYGGFSENGGSYFLNTVPCGGVVPCCWNVNVNVVGRLAGGCELVQP
jgi:hypothetical protein